MSEDPKLTEVIGHRDAVQFVRQLATDIGHSGLREIDVRNLHRMLMASEPRIAGQYKVFDNQISGSKELLRARTAASTTTHCHTAMRPATSSRCSNCSPRALNGRCWR